MQATVHPGLLLDHLEANEADLIEMCDELVSIESPSNDPGATRAILEHLTNEFIRLGYQYRLSPPDRSGGYLYARPRHHRRRAPMQLILGHVDTVWPIGTLAARPWTVDGAALHGPGCST